MKRICGIVFIVLLFLISVAGCGSDSSSAASSIIKKQADITEEFVNGLTNSKNADDAARAIDNYTDGLKKLIPELIEFQKKYPEFRDGEVPEGLEADVRKMEEVSMKMSEAMDKTMQYMMDPKVVEAMTRMGEELSKIEQ